MGGKDMPDDIILEGVRLTLRNDTSTNWITYNPILIKGEMGIEIDTGKFKFGDGVTKWNNLKYSVAEDEAVVSTINPTSANSDYKIGTIWVNTVSDKAFICCDNTTNKAVWKEVATPEDFLTKTKFATNEKANEGYVDKAITADTAKSVDKLTTPVDITLTGDVSGTVAFDGSGDVDITTSLINSGVAAGTYTKVTVDSKGRVTVGDNLAVADIPDLTLSKITDAGTVASKNAGNTAGSVPVIGEDGKLDTGILPAIAITEVFEAASEAGMLSLNAQTGDVCVRSDINKSFILKENDPSVLSHWVELKTPTGGVLSVNGLTGAVTLTSDNITEGSNNLYYTEARADANFESHYSTDLMDGADILKKTSTFIIDCGNAQDRNVASE